MNCSPIGCPRRPSHGAGGDEVAYLERFLDGLRSYFASLPADRFPLTMALAGPLTAGAAGDERFEFGISVITAGLASLAERK